MLSNKILPVALGAALLGGTVGALVMRPGSNRVATNDTATQQAPASTQRNLTASTTATDQTLPADAQQQVALNTDKTDNNLTTDERDAYRDGFSDGVKAARDNGATTRTVTRYDAAPATSGVAYRPATRTRYARTSNSPRRVYYDYSQPRSRSFWDKHRDKLTVAGGTGVAAIIGGLIGGKKGAAIGALSGAGGSALYTYKIRKRTRRY